MLLRSLLAALANRNAKQRQASAQSVKGERGRHEQGGPVWSPAVGRAIGEPVRPIERQGSLPRDPAIDRAIGEPDELDTFLALPLFEQMERISAEIGRLSETEQRLVLDTLRSELRKLWIPMPGPQTQAVLSQADELLYGGAAGGGKSAMEVGCAVTQHKRSLILRRQGTELDGLVEYSREVIGPHGSFNSSPGIREWTFDDGRSIKFGGCKDPDSWRDYAGRARDLICFDEAAEFLEEQVSSLIAWNRTTEVGQRCRVIFGSNPPRGQDGRWLFEWFEPWLDPMSPNPAVPGELRWFIRVGNDTRWVDGPAPVVINGEEYTPRSRTFIPARLDDNPYQARTNYKAQLQNLPEPLRSQLLKGDFLAGREDDAWQVIPTEWIEAAQNRWTEKPPSGRPMTSIGVDVAQGGADETILQGRHGNWFGFPVAKKGVDTKDSQLMAGLIFGAMRDSCEVVIDLGGGWGGEIYGHLKEQGLGVTAFMGINPSTSKTQDGKMAFRNLRAETWWKFREALDPANGQNLALPPDQKLAADLATPRWKLTSGGILIETKDDIRKRLGRSPDRGDAATMAWAYGGLREMERAETQRRAVTANLGYASAKQKLPGGGQREQPRVNLGYAQGRRR